MRAGRLRHYVTVAQPPTWTTFVNAWAAIEPKIDTSYDNPDSMKTDVPVNIRMRADSNNRVLPGMRIVWGTRLYDVVSTAITNERGAELLINAREYVGETATYTPDGGSAVTISARILTAVDFDGGETETAERDTVIAALKSAFAATPGIDDTIAIRGTTYTIVGLDDQGDDGIEYRFRVREP